MYLSHHQTATGHRWALEGSYLPRDVTLERLLEMRGAGVRSFLEDLGTEGPAEDPLLPPIEPAHEVWASGVTYLQSREARELESTDADAYQKLYDAERPELFPQIPSGHQAARPSPYNRQIQHLPLTRTRPLAFFFRLLVRSQPRALIRKRFSPERKMNKPGMGWLNGGNRKELGQLFPCISHSETIKAAGATVSGPFQALQPPGRYFP